MAFPPVPPTTSSPSVELLMDVANTTQEITPASQPMPSQPSPCQSRGQPCGR
jgi:hypothetical protein